MSRRIKSVHSRVLVYDIDTAGGQSGAPVWWLKNGSRYAVGIHTNGDLGGNSATRITQPVFDNIKLWKSQGS
jgi:V8-like Glu-specific endopeptidase